MIYKLHEGFYKKLRAIDPYLDARFDTDQMAILVSAKRPGRPAVHEATFHVHAINEEGVVIHHRTIDDLEDYIIRRLPEMDVWKRFGSGKAYDDHLAGEEEKDLAGRKRAFRSARLARLKEDRPFWEAAIANAQSGRMTKKDVLPYTTSTEAVGIALGASKAKNDEPKQEGNENVAT